MNKVAANQQIDATQRQKIATFTFATSIAAPTMGLSAEKVKSISASFAAGLQKRANRHLKLVELFRSHISA